MARHLEKLVLCVSKTLQVAPDAIDAEISFVRHGGDSLGAAYVTEELADHGLELDMVDLLDDEPLQRVALGIKEHA